jgi:hypothetical protein
MTTTMTMTPKPRRRGQPRPPRSPRSPVRRTGHSSQPGCFGFETERMRTLKPRVPARRVRWMAPPPLPLRQRERRLGRCGAAGCRRRRRRRSRRRCPRRAAPCASPSGSCPPPATATAGRWRTSTGPSIGPPFYLVVVVAGAGECATTAQERTYQKTKIPNRT